MTQFGFAAAMDFDCVENKFELTKIGLSAQSEASAKVMMNRFSIRIHTNLTDYIEISLSHEISEN